MPEEQLRQFWSSTLPHIPTLRQRRHSTFLQCHVKGYRILTMAPTDLDILLKLDDLAFEYVLKLTSQREALVKAYTGKELADGSRRVVENIGIDSVRFRGGKNEPLTPALAKQIVRSTHTSAPPSAKKRSPPNQKAYRSSSSTHHPATHSSSAHASPPSVLTPVEVHTTR